MNMRRLTVLLLLPVATSVAAQVKDTAIRYADAPRYPGVTRLTEELRIGVASGPEHYMFGDIHDVAVSPTGVMYVVDRQSNIIRVYDRQGRHLRSFGQRGQGPGDIQTPSGIAILRDGRVLLYDTGNRRVNVYSADGKSLVEWPVASGGTALVPRLLAVDSAGFARIRVVGSTTISSTRVLEVSHTWLRLRTTDGAIMDSLPEPPWPPYAEPFIARSGSGARRQMAVPFAPPRIAIVNAAGQLVTAVPATYAFNIVTSAGVQSVRRREAPPQVSKAERDSLRQRIEKPMREVDPTWSFGARDIPSTKPAFADIFPAADGRLWIQRERAPVARPQRGPRPGRGGASAIGTLAFDGDEIVERPIRYDVFEGSGAFLGAVEFPVRLSPCFIRGDTVWAMWRDEDDVQYLKRLRVTWR